MGSPVTIVVDRRNLLEALRIALVGSGDLSVLTIAVEAHRVVVSRDLGEVGVSVALRAETDEEAAFHVGGRVLARLLRSLTTKSVRLVYEDGVAEIRSGRTRFALYAGPPLAVEIAAPLGGMTVVTDDYLRAFQSVLALGTADLAQNVIRLTPDAGDLRLDFHTFEFAVSDVAVGYGGSIGEREALVHVGTLELLVSRFSQRSPRLRVVTDGLLE